MEDINQALRNYGWVAVFILVLIRETFPLILKTTFPAFARRKQAETDNAQREKEFARSKEQEELSHRRTVELRQLAAFEQIANNTEATRRVMEGIQVFLNSVSERLERVDEKTDKTVVMLTAIHERMPKHPEDAQVQKEKTTPRRRSTSDPRTS